MAEAKITIQFTPAEFDLIRAAIEARAKDQRQFVQQAPTPREGAEAREDAARLENVLAKLR